MKSIYAKGRKDWAINHFASNFDKFCAMASVKDKRISRYTVSV